MNMQLVTANTSEYQEIADLTNANKIEFCQKRRFYFKSITMLGQEPLFAQRVMVWRKMIEDLDSHWFWFTGSDLLIMNFDALLPILIGCDLIISMDVNGLNSDSILIRRSDDSKRLLDRAIELVCKQEKDDQEALTAAIEEYPEQVKIVPQRTINAYDYTLYPHYKFHKRGQYRDGDLALHFPGMPYKQKLQLVKTYLPLVRK